MAEVQPEFTSRLPRWLAWYLEYGLEGEGKRQRRKHFALNVISLTAGLNTSAFVAGYLLFDWRLWPAAFVAILVTIFYLSLPAVFHALPKTLTLLYVVLGSCGFFFWLTYLLGSGSGLYFFLLIVPGAILVVLGPAWRTHLTTAVVICSGTIVAILLINGEPALAAGNSKSLQTTLIFLSVFGTCILSIAVAYVAFLQAETAEDALEAEHARSEALLYNLLPTEIAARLKDAPDQTIADSLDHTAILFADIVDFTPRSAQMSPEALVEFLNRIFSTFDELAAIHGLEKIKTIGDAYMVAAGLPHPIDRPVHRVAEMAFDMLDALRDLSAELNDPIDIRIGLHTGPVVAGVIGHQKLFYDVWGDTVNTASRMESHGQPGRIQVTAAAREALKDAYDFEPRGAVEIKGIGRLETWWLAQRT
ncbi:hypothetical protein KBY23_18695 [Ruegeria pomeroyi]|nr:hypothetical protein [Ruegeria pomeroyi]